MTRLKTLLLAILPAAVFAAAPTCRSKKADITPTTAAGEESGVEEVAQPMKLIGLKAGAAEAEERREGGKKILMIIACSNFRDEELEKPKEIFEREGFAVTVASDALSGCKGMLGYEAKVDIPVEKASAADYDAILFVGGVGAKRFIDDAGAHKIARDAAAQGKLVAAICIAPSILAKAGVLKNKKATVWEGKEFVNILEDGGAEYTGEALTVDGKIVTANGPQEASRFGEKIVEILKK